MGLAVGFSEKERVYTGPELRPHFLLTELSLRGSAIGAFIGACDVKTEHLVDWEDRLAQDHIRAKKMVHFIGEFFGLSLREGVLIQRLFMSSLYESLVPFVVPQVQGRGLEFWREGDDLYVGRGEQARKLSVSIVTASPVSQLLHVGINIDPEGAPVAAIGLNELNVDAPAWARQVLERFAGEWEGMEWACAKVRPVM
jgi:hypothetical protein